MKIYCCQCEKEIFARLTNGKEVYPHRGDLHDLPFWKCDACKNHVGCHHYTSNRTKPLGCIATRSIQNARMHIHSLLDPLWKGKLISRKNIYEQISKEVGYEYHTAEIKSIKEARKIYVIIRNIANELRR